MIDENYFLPCVSEQGLLDFKAQYITEINRRQTPTSIVISTVVPEIRHDYGRVWYSRRSFHHLRLCKKMDKTWCLVRGVEYYDLHDEKLLIPLVWEELPTLNGE